MGIDLVGIWFGPFPTLMCELINITKGTITFSLVFVLFNIFIIKFMFVCVWKKMKMMNDFLLFHLISRIFVMYAFGMSIIKDMAPGRPVLNVVSNKWVSLIIPNYITLVQLGV